MAIRRAILSPIRSINTYVVLTSQKTRRSSNNRGAREKQSRRRSSPQRWPIIAGAKTQRTDSAAGRQGEFPPISCPCVPTTLNSVSIHDFPALSLQTEAGPGETPPATITVPQADLKPLYDDLQDCRANSIQYDAAKKDLADEQAHARRCSHARARFRDRRSPRWNVVGTRQAQRKMVCHRRCRRSCCGSRRRPPLITCRCGARSTIVRHLGQARKQYAQRYPRHWKASSNGGCEFATAIL